MFLMILSHYVVKNRIFWQFLSLYIRIYVEGEREMYREIGRERERGETEREGEREREREERQRERERIR